PRDLRRDASGRNSVTTSACTQHGRVGAQYTQRYGGAARSCALRCGVPWLRDGWTSRRFALQGTVPSAQSEPGRAEPNPQSWCGAVRMRSESRRRQAGPADPVPRRQDCKARTYRDHDLPGEGVRHPVLLSRMILKALKWQKIVELELKETRSP